MKKQLQNKIAESRLLLPLVAAYGFMVWLLAGVATQNWWLQLGCFAVSSYLMVQMNNVHVLIRIYSRMVSGMFIAMSCTACFLFGSLPVAIHQMLMTASLLLLFTTYQDRNASGRSYYAFLAWALISMIEPQIVYFIPMLWLFMIFSLQCISWKTWTASLLGLLTPYWMWTGWLLYQGDLSLMLTHLSSLSDFNQPFDYSTLTLPQVLVFIYVVALAITGIIHFLRKSYMEEIRTRMLYSCLIWLDIAAIVFLVLQPQHYDMLMVMMIITTAPLIGHYLALTNTKVTNISFFVLAGLTVVLTLFNILWSI